MTRSEKDVSIKSLSFNLDLSVIIPETLDTYTQLMNALPTQINTWYLVESVSDLNKYESSRIECTLNYLKGDVNCGRYGNYSIDQCFKAPISSIGSCMWSGKHGDSKCGPSLLDANSVDLSGKVCNTDNPYVETSYCNVRGMVLQCLNNTYAHSNERILYFIEPLYYFISENALIKKMKLIASRESTRVDWGRAAIGILCPGCWGFFGGGSSDANVLSDMQVEMKKLEEQVNRELKIMQGQIAQLSHDINTAVNYLGNGLVEVTSTIMRIMNINNFLDQVHFKLLDLDSFYTMLNSLPDVGMSSLSTVLDVASLKNRIENYTKTEMDLSKFKIKHIKNGFLLEYPVSETKYYRYTPLTVYMTNGTYKIYDDILISKDMRTVVIGDTEYLGKDMGINCILDTCVVEDDGRIGYELFSSSFFIKRTDDFIVINDEHIQVHISCNNTNTTYYTDGILKIPLRRCGNIVINSTNFYTETTTFELKIDVGFPMFIEMDFIYDNVTISNVTTFSPSTIDYSKVDNEIANLKSEGRTMKIIGIIVLVIIIIIFIYLLCQFVPRFISR